MSVGSRGNVVNVAQRSRLWWQVEVSIDPCQRRVVSTPPWGHGTPLTLETNLFFTWGPVMDHAETVLQPCLEPYSSLVFLFRVLKSEWQFPMEFHTLLQFISVYHCLSQVSKDIDIIIYTHMIIYYVYICSGLNPLTIPYERILNSVVGKIWETIV